MKIHYTLDDGAARLPLSIRSADAVWDRAADLRTAPGVQLVELTTQHMLGTGLTLVDELAAYFEKGRPTDADPYALEACYDNRTELEDLLRDLRELRPGLVALHEVAELFPISFEEDLQFLLALTVVGYPAFGYVRTYRDSEGEEYHGMVVNLAQARPHLERLLGRFSLETFVDSVRHGFFNHEGFLMAYADYRQAVGRDVTSLGERIKDALMSRGIAWFLSYRHNLPFYDQALGLSEADLPQQVARCNDLLAHAHHRRGDPLLEEWHPSKSGAETCVDTVGYFAARAIAAQHGPAGLREAIAQGPDRFIQLYNQSGNPALRAG